MAPNDLAIIFNLALAEQKGFEILSSLPCERRTLDQCIKAGEDIVESQSCVPTRPTRLTRFRLFERLTMNPTPNTPYDPTLPGSRMKYGVSLERKRHELVSAQTAFAEVELTRINEAKVIRDAEKARLEEIEMARREKERETAEKLEEQRRILREEAREYGASKFDSDDDDKKKRGKGNKRKSGKGKKDGDGSESDEAPEKPKRKKARRLLPLLEAFADPERRRGRRMPTRPTRTKTMTSPRRSGCVVHHFTRATLTRE